MRGKNYLSSLIWFMFNICTLFRLICIKYFLLLFSFVPSKLLVCNSGYTQSIIYEYI
jgi:hypothetical protein